MPQGEQIQRKQQRAQDRNPELNSNNQVGMQGGLAHIQTLGHHWTETQGSTETL